MVSVKIAKTAKCRVVKSKVIKMEMEARNIRTAKEAVKGRSSGNEICERGHWEQ